MWPEADKTENLLAGAKHGDANAVNRLLRSDAIQKDLPEAHRHLDNALSRGTFLSYMPETRIDWGVSTEKTEPLHAM